MAATASAGMTLRDIGALVALAALWGASFLFMRIAAPHFGPVALAALRVGGAALLLMPILVARAGLVGLARHWRPIGLIGLLNSALPFAAFSLAALSLPAGLSSVLNATSPMFATLIAAAWLREPISASRIAGLCIGFGGVVLLTLDTNALTASDDGAGVPLAIGLCLVASTLYGFSACFAKRYLADAEPLAVAAGSQVAAALWLAAPATWTWPPANPAWPQWLAVLGLAFLCTGLAYVLYFRLIASIGPARSITVTFLVPVFAMSWAWLFLGEPVTLDMLAAGGLIVLGTVLATGIRPSSPPSLR